MARGVCFELLADSFANIVYDLIRYEHSLNIFALLHGLLDPHYYADISRNFQRICRLIVAKVFQEIEAGSFVLNISKLQVRIYHANHGLLLDQF